MAGAFSVAGHLESLSSPEGRLEVGLVNLVAAKLLADTATGKAAMQGAAINPTAVLLKYTNEVSALDALGELVGELLQGTAVIEIKTEGFFAQRHDLGGQI